MYRWWGFLPSRRVCFFRGFIRELLSLGAWVGAAIITLYFFPHATEMMKNHVKSEHLAAGVSALGTYIASLISITIMNSILLPICEEGIGGGLLDNFLGLMFGAMRGAFILSLGFLIMTTVIPQNNPPEMAQDRADKAVSEKRRGCALCGCA